MYNGRGLPMDVQEDNSLKGPPRNNMNDMNVHRNHNMPLAKQLIDRAEAERMRSGFNHRHAPEETKIRDNSKAPLFHDSGEMGEAPEKFSYNENSYR